MIICPNCKNPCKDDASFCGNCGFNITAYNTPDMENQKTRLIRTIQTPVQNAPTQNAPVQNAPTQNAPVQNAPTQNAPVQNAPVQNTPVQRPTFQNAPIQRPPVQRPPIQRPPVQNESDKSHFTGIIVAITILISVLLILGVLLSLFFTGILSFDNESSSESDSEPAITATPSATATPIPSATATPAPSAPVALTTPQVSDFHLVSRSGNNEMYEITWNPVSGAIGYEVRDTQHSVDSPNSPYQNTYTTTSTKHQVGASVGVSAEVSVRAFREDQHGNRVYSMWSPTKTVSICGGYVPPRNTTTPSPSEDPNEIKYRVRNKNYDASSQIGAYHDWENAKEAADKNPGYYVFDMKGNLLYTP